MLKDFLGNWVYPVVVLSGSIIGVGFLALPYITLQVGAWAMLFYFVVLTALMIFIHTIMGEISLKTPDFKRFPGFAEYHLGKVAKSFAVVLSIFGLFGVLLAYLIVGGEFLTAILSPVFGGNVVFYVVIYFLAASFIIYFGVRTVARIELLVLLLFISIIIMVFLKSFSFFNAENIFLNSSPLIKNWRLMFLPYGAILFSLWGTGLIPEVEEMIIGRKRALKKIVVVATLIPAIVYFLFTLVVLGITGSETTDSALVGLKDFFGNGIAALALSIGVMTTFAAFIAHGLLLKEIFIYDIGLKKLSAWALTSLVPFALFSIGITAFIPLISFIGGVFLSINGILILLIYKKIGGRKTVIYPLSLVFVLGIIYEIIYFVR